MTLRAIPGSRETDTNQINNNLCIRPSRDILEINVSHWPNPVIKILLDPVIDLL